MSVYSNRCQKPCLKCLSCRFKSPYNEMCQLECEECGKCVYDRDRYGKYPPVVRPRYYYTEDLVYDVNMYKPNMYWYPNPLGCRDVCGGPVCDVYEEKLRNYRMCRQCQLQNPPKCWSPKDQKCVKCPLSEAWRDCQSSDRYGCRNLRGYLHRNTRPINPKYTFCKLCR